MKNIKRLKILLNLILILGIIGIVIVPFVAAFSNNLNIEGEKVTEWTALLFSKAFIATLVYIIFLIAIYKLQVAIKNFYQFQLFNEVVSKAFKQIGYLIIMGTLTYIILNWVVDALIDSHFRLDLNFTYLIHAAAALFFFTLSTMIDKAKGIQNENNLTI